jgi:hypothetical protein
MSTRNVSRNVSPLGNVEQEETQNQDTSDDGGQNGADVGDEKRIHVWARDKVCMCIHSHTHTHTYIHTYIHICIHMRQLFDEAAALWCGIRIHASRQVTSFCSPTEKIRVVSYIQSCIHRIIYE